MDTGHGFNTDKLMQINKMYSNLFKNYSLIILINQVKVSLYSVEFLSTGLKNGCHYSFKINCKTFYFDSLFSV